MIWLVVMAEHLRQWVQELVVHGKNSGSSVVCYSGSRVYLWCNGGRFISVVLDQPFCTFVKHGNLLLRMRQGYMGWSAAWSGWCVRWDWLIGCRLMFFVIELKYSYTGCTFRQCLCDFLLVTYLVLLDNCLWYWWFLLWSWKFKE